MTKKKRDLIIAVVLVVFFMLSFVKNIIKPGSRARGASAVAEQALPPVDAQAAASSLERVRQNEKNLSAQEAFWEKDWGRDPFFVSGSEALSGVGLILSGIVWDEKMPVAMINEKVLKIGDVIEGYRLVMISPSSVTIISSSGKESEVRLFEAIPE